MLDREAKERANAQAKARANANAAKARANANAGVPYTFKNVSKFNSAMVNAAQGPITGVNYVPGSRNYLPPSAMNYRPAVGNPSLLGLAVGAMALSAGSGRVPQATAYPSITPK
jgi:hypothetical protein